MEQFVVKTTTELTADEKQQILNLFNTIMDKNRPMNEFVNQNIQNPMGYSYHTLYIVDGKIVGHNAGVPSYYNVNSERIKVICNIDTIEDDLSACWIFHTVQATQKCTLTGAGRTDDNHNVALVHSDVDAFQDFIVTKMFFKINDFYHSFSGSFPSF